MGWVRGKRMDQRAQHKSVNNREGVRESDQIPEEDTARTRIV